MFPTGPCAEAADGVVRSSGSMNVHGVSGVSYGQYKIRLDVYSPLKCVVGARHLFCSTGSLLSMMEKRSRNLDDDDVYHMYSLYIEHQDSTASANESDSSTIMPDVEIH